MDWLKHNRDAWAQEVLNGNCWTVPVAAARGGRATLLLTPTKPMPADWFGDVAGKRILCLAAAGGQQGPLFAAMGADVTVFDNCPAQLDGDREVARREGLAIRLEQGDMRDLSRFDDDSFDLVFHPISNVFVDDVLPVWRGAFRVLRPGGRLAAGVMNPVAYLFDSDRMEKEGVLDVRYRIPYADLDQLPEAELKRRIDAREPLEFGHTLADQIGGQLAAGFRMIGFYEDVSGWDEVLDRHLPVYIATLSEKPEAVAKR